MNKICLNQKASEKIRNGTMYKGYLRRSCEKEHRRCYDNDCQHQRNEDLVMVLSQWYWFILMFLAGYVQTIPKATPFPPWL